MSWVSENKGRKAALGLAAAGAVVLGGVAVAALTGGSAPVPLDPSAGLRIDVVQPPAPPIEPGSRMDVGDLVDDYEHRPIAAPMSEMDAYHPAYQTAWVEPEPDGPAWSGDSGRPAAEPYTEPEPGPEVRGRWFGFDDPRPDWAARRRERQERLDRLEALRDVPPEAVGVQPALRSDSAFY